MCTSSGVCSSSCRQRGNLRNAALGYRFLFGTLDERTTPLSTFYYSTLKWNNGQVCLFKSWLVKVKIVPVHITGLWPSGTEEKWNYKAETFSRTDSQQSPTKDPHQAGQGGGALSAQCNPLRPLPPAPPHMSSDSPLTTGGATKARREEKLNGSIQEHELLFTAEWSSRLCGSITTPSCPLLICSGGEEKVRAGVQQPIRAE